MPKILVTPDFLKAKATELNTAQDTLNSTMSAIQNLAASLPAEWKGAAYTAFMQSYESKKQVYKTFSNDIKKFADFLNDYAATMETADVGGASTANGMA